MSLATLENVSLKIDGKPIIDKVSLSLEKGKITTLIGPNGGGKTSIARILLEVLKPTSGTIKKDSTLKIGYMPQKITIDKTIPLTVFDFITLSSRKVNFDEGMKNLAARLKIENLLNKQIHNF